MFTDAKQNKEERNSADAYVIKAGYIPLLVPTRPDCLVRLLILSSYEAYTADTKIRWTKDEARLLYYLSNFH
jgi:hypothetical protein